MSVSSLLAAPDQPGFGDEAVLDEFTIPFGTWTEQATLVGSNTVKSHLFGSAVSISGDTALIGAYREYRWRKWERRIRLDRNDHLWRPTAQWVADRYEDDGVVERVVLIRIFSDTPEPGSGDERVWETVEFYDYDVTTGERSS